MIRFACYLTVLSFAAGAEPREGCLELRKTARFTAYFERVDIEKLAQTVSDATCLSFIMGENVKGKITIIGPENGKLKLDADQFYAAFQAALDANGFATVQQGRFTRIVEKPRAKQTSTPLLAEADAFPASGEIVTRVFRLRNVEAESLRAALTGFLSQGGELTIVPPEVVIVTDLSVNQQRIARLVEQLDLVRTRGDVLRLVAVKHAAADEVLDKVQRALAPKPGARVSETLTAVTDERTNRLLLAGAPDLVERAAQLIEQLDVAIAVDSRARVHRLKNADAKEVATALEAMTQTGRAKPGQPAAATQGLGEVRISVSESLNALLIVSSAGDYRALAAVIDELDRPVRQVFIETLIMEVNLQRDAQFGISAHMFGASDSASWVAGSQPADGASSLSLKSLAGGSGLLLGLQGPVLAQVSKLLGVDVGQFGVTIQASQKNSDVNVLSMPHILTADNKEAEIAVGQRVPFQLGTSQTQLASLLASGTPGAANLLSAGSISREKVELKLTVKPHIGDGDDIRLEINQQAEELAGTSSSAGPITSTRNQRATVVARNEETLVLGGIMQDRDLDEVSKVPVLGDIPIIGGLFRRTSKTHTKVNLLVFLTPHIIRDASDYKRVVERKLQERARAMEELRSTQPEPERTIDFGRKQGPLAAIAKVLAREARRPEHGGDGEPGDRVVDPR